MLPAGLLHPDEPDPENSFNTEREELTLAVPQNEVHGEVEDLELDGPELLRRPNCSTSAMDSGQLGDVSSFLADVEALQEEIQTLQALPAGAVIRDNSTGVGFLGVI